MMQTMDSETTLPPWPEKSPWGTGRMSVSWADLLTAFGISPEAIKRADGGLEDMREQIATDRLASRQGRWGRRQEYPPVTITARFPGNCPRCGNDIEVGESIEWARGAAATHTDCSCPGR